MSTYALAIPESYVPRPPTYGSRAQLAAATGDVEGYLTLVGYDKRTGTASYALRIVNQSDHLLHARMTCATLRRESILAYPLDVRIAPFSVSETLLPVRIADVGPYDRAIVQVEGGSIAFSLEAPAPARMANRSRWPITMLSALLFTIACAFAAASSTPRLTLLAAPARTFAGSAIDVPYAFGGWASMQYALQTRDGRQLAAGLLGAREGTIHFSVPRTAGSDVVLSVNVNGPFGRLSTARSIAIAQGPAPKRAAAAPAAPRISAFAIAAPRVRAGEVLNVSYITNASEGEIWLIDDTGQLWAREAVPPAGDAAIPVPPAAAGHQLRVVLHARNGAGDAVASASVVVLPGAVRAQPAAGADPPATLNLSAEQLVPGQNFTVTVTSAHTDAVVTLTDKGGNQLQQGEVSADQDAVTLTAPAAAEATVYYITANITRGVSQVTVVRKITVAPSS